MENATLTARISWGQQHILDCGLLNSLYTTLYMSCWLQICLCRWKPWNACWPESDHSATLASYWYVLFVSFLRPLLFILCVNLWSHSCLFPLPFLVVFLLVFLPVLCSHGVWLSISSLVVDDELLSNLESFLHCFLTVFPVSKDTCLSIHEESLQFWWRVSLSIEFAFLLLHHSCCNVVSI